MSSHFLFKILYLISLLWVLQESVEAVKLGRIVPFDRSEMAEILITHNRLRSSVEPEASDMQPLIWNHVLAEKARTSAMSCQQNADPNRANGTKFYAVGKNSAIIGSARGNNTRLIKGWYTQGLHYDYDKNECTSTGICSFYRQLVWSDSTDIGCGAAVCPRIPGFPISNSYFFVCYYGPEKISDMRPYSRGKPCSNCRYVRSACFNNLCVPSSWYSSFFFGSTTPTTPTTAIVPMERSIPIMLSPRHINKILTVHNKIRSVVRPEASNMQSLKWSNVLADNAQYFAQSCQPESNPRRAHNTKFNTVGENWSMHGNRSYYNYTRVIMLEWYAQRAHYNYEYNQCSTLGTCSAYKQLVWADSSEIGCGAALCSHVRPSPHPVTHSIFFVCYYGTEQVPGMRPYRNGMACSECRNPRDECVNNLCISGSQSQTTKPITKRRKSITYSPPHTAMRSTVKFPIFILEDIHPPSLSSAKTVSLFLGMTFCVASLALCIIVAS